MGSKGGWVREGEGEAEGAKILVFGTWDTPLFLYRTQFLHLQNQEVVSLLWAVCLATLVSRIGNASSPDPRAETQLLCALKSWDRCKVISTVYHKADPICSNSLDF